MNGGWSAGSITSKMVLDKTKWSQSVKDVKKDQKTLGGFSEQTSQKFKKMGAAMTVAGGLIVGSIGMMIKKYVEAGDEIDKMSRRTGFAATTLSELKYAADISGASLTDVEKGVKRMSKTIVDASEGMATYIRAFDRIGISVEDLMKLKPEDQFLKIADAIAQVEDPTIRAATAQDIFGRAGTKLLPLFQSGEKGLAALRDEAHKLGIVFDQEAAIKAAKLKDAQTALGESVKGLGFSLATTLVPALTSFIQKLTDTVSKITAWAKAHPALFSALTKAATALGGIMLVLGPMLIILPKIVAGIAMLKGSLVALTGPIGLVVAGLTALTIGLLKVKAARDEANKSAEQALEIEKKLSEKVMAAMKSVGMTAKEYLKLRDAYDGNVVAMTMAIKKGKEGKELQEALAKVGKKHREEIEKQKDVTEDYAWLIKKDYTEALKDAMEKTQTWVDFIRDKGITTIQEKEKRVDELEAILRDLEKAYDDGRLSLEDYTKAVVAAKNEIIDLIPPTAILAGRDLSDTLGYVQEDLQQVSYWSTLAGDKLQRDFAQASGQSIWELRQKIYDLSRSIMSFAGITMPDLVISNKNAFSQIRDEHTKTQNRWDQMADGIRTKWTNELSQVLQGAKSLGGALKGVWGTVKQQFFDMVADMIAKWTFGLIGNILDGSKGLLDGLGGIFDGIGKTGKDTAEGVSSSFLDSFGKIAGAIGIGLLIAKFVDLKAIGKAASDALVTAFNAVGNVIQGVGNIFSAVFGAGANIITGIGNVISGLTNAIASLGGLISTGGKKYSEITFWLKPIRWDTKEVRDFLFNDVRWWFEHYDKIFQKIKDKAIATADWSYQIKQNISGSNSILDASKSILKSIDSSIHGAESSLLSALNTIADNTAGIIDAISKIGGAQAGAVLRSPRLIMTHGTPAIPEIVAPATIFERVVERGGIATKTISVDLKNEVNLSGLIITDREYTRNRLIPEILNSLDANYKKTDWLEKLGLK